MDYAAQRQVVDGIYRQLGLTPSWNTIHAPGSGYVYDGKGVGLRYDVREPGLALHDAAHYLVCPPHRRGLPNFGLGPADHVKERKRAPRAIPEEEAANEEWRATVLNVVLAEILFKAGADVYRLLSLYGRAFGVPQTKHLGMLFSIEDVERLWTDHGVRLPRTREGVRRLVRARTYLLGS